MKTFKVNGKEYEIRACTAICDADHRDERKRQEALLVSYHNETETVEYIVFGYDMPETMNEFLIICEDLFAWESNWEVLETLEIKKILR